MVEMRCIRWAGIVARRGGKYQTFWSGSLKVRDHSKDRVLHLRIILKWILWKYG
jgi:hypothetical protein